MYHQTDTDRIEQDVGPSIESLSQDLLGVARRKKRLILFIAAAVTLIVYLAMQFVSDKYDATAKLIVKLGPENADVPLTVDKGSVHRQGVMKEEVNTYISLMGSVSLLEQVVDQIGIQRFQHQQQEPSNPVDWMKIQLKSLARWGKARLNDALILVNLRPRLGEKELIVVGLQRQLSIHQEKESNVISLQLRLPDPVLAKDVLDALIENYLVSHEERFLSDNSVTLAFETQVDQHKKVLDERYATRAASQRALGVSSIDDRRRALESLTHAIEGELLQNRRRLAQLKATSDEIVRNVTHIEELVLSERLLRPNASRDAIERSIADLDVTRASLLSDFLDRSPKIQAVDYEIGALTKELELKAEDSTLSLKYVRNPVLTQFETQIQSMAVEKASLASLLKEAEAQLAAIRAEANLLNESDAAIHQLELEISVAEQRLRYAATKLEEARSRDLLRANDVANVDVLIAPSYNPKPAAPRRLLLMVAAAVGSVGLGFALALFLEWQDPRVYELRDLRGMSNVIVFGRYRAAR